MRLNNVEIPMCEWDVHCLMGLKNEGDTVCFEEYSPDPILLRKYTDGSTGKILVPNLISSIKNNPKADDHFKRCFVLLLIGTILAPNSKLEVPSYYLKLVAEVEQIQKYNWSKMMLDFLFSSIHTTKLEKHNNLHGCTIFLQLWYYEHVLMNEAYNNSGNSTFPLMANWNERRCKLRDKYDDQHGCGNGKIIMKLIMPSTEEYFIQRDRTEDYRNKNINARNGDKSARSNERSSSKIPNSRIKKETSAESPDKRNETERPVKPTIPKEAIDIISRRMSALERSVRRIEDEFKRRLSRIEDMLMVMDAYSTLLTHRLTLRDGNNKRIRYMSVFEYHTLSTLCKDVAKNVRFPPVVEMRWAKRGKELLEYDMVFFPINPGGHWYVIVMRIDLKDFLVLDSLERNESSYIMDMNFLRDGIQILIRKMREVSQYERKMGEIGHYYVAIQYGARYPSTTG